MDTVNKRSIFRFSRPRLPVLNDWFENLIEIYQKMDFFRSSSECFSTHSRHSPMPRWSVQLISCWMALKTSSTQVRVLASTRGMSCYSLPNAHRTNLRDSYPPVITSNSTSHPRKGDRGNNCTTHFNILSSSIFALTNCEAYA